MIRNSIRLAAAGALLLAAPLLAQAQSWPTKPIRLIVAFPAGGIVDTVARQIQPALQGALGQPVVIDNRGGAGGTIGSTEVARAEPDGHTLLMIFDSYATYPLVYPKLGFDPAKDLKPVTLIASNPLVRVVNPRVQANDLKTFVSLVRAEPDRFNYASVGAGSSNHLTAELFQEVSGTTITHVPYRGGGPAQQDLVGGQVQMMFLSASLAHPHVKAGALRALAQTGAERIAAYPDTPTVAESGFPDFTVSSWVGLLAPAGTPQSIVDRLRAEIRRIVNEPALASRLGEQGLTGVAGTPDEFAETLRREREKWPKLVVQRKLKLD